MDVHSGAKSPKRVIAAKTEHSTTTRRIETTRKVACEHVVSLIQSVAITLSHAAVNMMSLCPFISRSRISFIGMLGLMSSISWHLA